MKTSYIGLLLCAAIAFTSCDNDADSLLDKPISGNVEGNTEGYSMRHSSSTWQFSRKHRAAVNGNSEQIQSLVCLIYKNRQTEHTGIIQKTVLKYEGTVGNINPQIYDGLKQNKLLNFPMDYKAVFVVNTDKNLFMNQTTMKF